MRELRSGLFFFGLSVLIVWESFRVELGTLKEPGSGFLSLCAGLAVGALSVVLIYRGWRAPRTGKTPLPSRHLGSRLSLYLQPRPGQSRIHRGNLLSRGYPLPSRTTETVVVPRRSECAGDLSVVPDLRCFSSRLFPQGFLGDIGSHFWKHFITLLSDSVSFSSR